MLWSLERSKSTVLLVVDPITFLSRLKIFSLPFSLLIKYQSPSDETIGTSYGVDKFYMFTSMRLLICAWKDLLTSYATHEYAVSVNRACEIAVLALRALLTALT